MYICTHYIHTRDACWNHDLETPKLESKAWCRKSTDVLESEKLQDITSNWLVSRHHAGYQIVFLSRRFSSLFLSKTHLNARRVVLLPKGDLLKAWHRPTCRCFAIITVYPFCDSFGGSDRDRGGIGEGGRVMHIIKPVWLTHGG